MLKKLHWALKRHPFLYIARFRLLSKNSNVSDIATISYNDGNKKEDIPKVFFEINSKLFPQGKPDSELAVVKQIVIWLNQNTKVGPGLSEPSDKALEMMVYGKGGVCSDMVQIFNNFCVINDIKVREWGTTSAPFNRENGGHSFNEVFIKSLQKWIFIDPSWGLFFYDEENSPLSVIEMFHSVRNKRAIFNKTIIAGKNIEEKLVTKNYLHSDITPFLICNYHNKTYDSILRLTKPFLPVFLIHFLVYIRGKSYHYKFPIDDYKKIFS